MTKEQEKINSILGIPCLIITINSAIVVSKLLGFLDWPWIWIFSPIWGFLVFQVLLITLVYFWRKQ